MNENSTATTETFTAAYQLDAIRQRVQEEAAKDNLITSVSVEEVFYVDLCFRVKGSLYDAETVVIKRILPQLREAFPNVDFDFLVVGDRGKA